VVACVLGGGAILLPSLALLFRLAVTGRFHGPEPARFEDARPGLRRVTSASPMLVRAAIACLTAGVVLLNVADAQWAHAVGVAGLIGFLVMAAGAIIPAALGEQPFTR
jgi:cytochrome d ubiquinol oxidase subunit II